jgi:hypothetical protein
MASAQSAARTVLLRWGRTLLLEGVADMIRNYTIFLKAGSASVSGGRKPKRLNVELMNCLPYRCFAFELGLPQATRPYRGCFAVLSALIRSLLLGLPLRVPLKRDLPKPFPRLCVRQSLICCIMKERGRWGFITDETDGLGDWAENCRAVGWLQNRGATKASGR